MQTANGPEDRVNASSELAVVAVIKTLQIDLVEVNPWAQVLEHLRRSVAVRNERSLKARCTRFFEDGYGPFARDQRLIIRTHQHFGALP